jgi:hypothetical protein
VQHGVLGSKGLYSRDKKTRPYSLKLLHLDETFAIVRHSTSPSDLSYKILWRNSPLLDNGSLKVGFIAKNMLVEIKVLPRD